MLHILSVLAVVFAVWLIVAIPASIQIARGRGFGSRGAGMPAPSRPAQRGRA